MNWTVKTENSSVDVASMDELRSTLLGLDEGTAYEVIINDEVNFQGKSGVDSVIALARSLKGKAINTKGIAGASAGGGAIGVGEIE